jgi:CRP/FNR family transcriptional regulator, cyclic AMP receptor protein
MAATTPTFDVQAFLGSHGLEKDVSDYDRGETIFVQGDACEGVLFVESGGVEVSVRSKVGRDAVLAILGPREFFGEGCLAGQPLRIGSATAITPSAVRRVAKSRMIRLLHDYRAMSDWFIAHLLSREIRIEQDLVDQLFNSSEKRLARTLLVLAQYGTARRPGHTAPKVSDAVLAEMAGTTRARVQFFLDKFKRLGFVKDGRDARLEVSSSLLNVVLHD